MKFASDFRRMARAALSGKWLLAVAVGLVASLLGGVINQEPAFRMSFDAASSGVALNLPQQNIFSFWLNPAIAAFITSVLILVLIIAIPMAVVYFILGSFVGVGYAKFNLELIDRNAAGFNTLFSCYNNWKTTAIARLLRGLYTFLWSLLFVIPGIMASYSYAMTDYILAENPNMTATEAIVKSKKIMYGNRWRLFCLQFSFIGWDILASLTFAIGYLFLTPYKQAAIAAFYRDITKNNAQDISEFFEE